MTLSISSRAILRDANGTAATAATGTAATGTGTETMAGATGWTAIGAAGAWQVFNASITSRIDCNRSAGCLAIIRAKTACTPLGTSDRSVASKGIGAC